MSSVRDMREMTTGVQARVLIVARDDTLAGALSEGLDRLGWRTITARGQYAAITAITDLQIEACIIDLASCGEESLGLARRLKAACAPRRIPIIAIGNPDPVLQNYGYDLTLAGPAASRPGRDAAWNPWCGWRCRRRSMNCAATRLRSVGAI